MLQKQCEQRGLVHLGMGGTEAWSGWSHGTHSQKPERERERGMLACFLLCVCHGKVQFTFRVCLPATAKSYQKHIHKHTQSCVSKVILNLVRLTVKAHHYGWLPLLTFFIRCGNFTHGMVLPTFGMSLPCVLNLSGNSIRGMLRCMFPN